MSRPAVHDAVSAVDPAAVDPVVVDPAVVDEPASTAVARVRDLHVTLQARDGAVQALRGVTLAIEPGEIVALVGESGSGKSILGASLLGLLPDTARPEVTGEVIVAGHDMVRSSDKDLRRVRKHLLGAVFQDPLTSLNPTMKIGRQLVERTDGMPRALRRLTEAGVPEPERRVAQFPHQLSGGLRQRVMIAMALGGDGRIDDAAVPADASIAVGYGDDGAPRLVIADEPTTALDVSVQAQIVLLFDRIRREHGCAVLLVTHDLGVAASVADRIAVMYAGRLCEVGAAADVLARPSHPYTKALLAARLSMDGARSTTDPLPGDPPNPMRPPPGCACAPRCSRASGDYEEAAPTMAPRPTGSGTVACFHAIDEAAPVPVAVRRAAAGDGRRPAASAQSEPALVLDRVSMTFASPGPGGRFHRMRLKAVQQVSLTVPARGAVALVGESGCGKTTTLRMAAGLSRPEEGTVTWADGAGRPQLIFQDASSSLTPWISILGQVEERFRHRGVPRAARRARADDILRRVGLDDRAARSRPRRALGGQRQRAVIARALASDPSLLICDEPVSALDASLVVRVLDLLEELRSQLGVALLVVTHDLAAARRIADTVAVMYLGRIVERAPADQLFAEPLHPYTLGLMAANPTTEPGRLAPTLSGEPPSATTEILGCAFAARCPIAVDRCHVETPRLRVLPTGREVACHLVEPQLHGAIAP